jgi:hypothetical protein
MNRPLGFILFLILATVVGCGGQKDKAKYANVKGKVTYNGNPIEKGEIAFMADGQPPSIMKIDSGAFNGQAMVGSNRVSVSAWKKASTARKLSPHEQTQVQGYIKKFQHAPKEGGPTAEYDATLVNYIPPEWGLQSKETRVVESGSTNEFEFNIKGKN